MTLEVITQKIVKVKADKKKQIEADLNKLYAKLKDYKRQYDTKQITEDYYYELIEPVDEHIEILRNELKGVIYVAEEIEENYEELDEAVKAEGKIRKLKNAINKVGGASAGVAKDKLDKIKDDLKSAVNPKNITRNLYESIKGTIAQDFPFIANMIDGAENVTSKIKDKIEENEKPLKKSATVSTTKFRQSSPKVQDVQQFVPQAPQVQPSASQLDSKEILNTFRSIQSGIMSLEGGSFEMLHQLEDINKEIKTLVDITANAWGVSQQQLDITKDNHQDMLAEARDSRFQRQEDASLNKVRQVTAEPSLFQLGPDEKEEKEKPTLTSKVESFAKLADMFADVGIVGMAMKGAGGLLASLTAPLAALAGVLTTLVTVVAGIAAVIAGLYVAYKSFQAWADTKEKAFGENATAQQGVAAAMATTVDAIDKYNPLSDDIRPDKVELARNADRNMTAIGKVVGPAIESTMNMLKEASTPYAGPKPASAIAREKANQESKAQGKGRVTAFVEDIKGQITPNNKKDVEAAKLVIGQKQIETFSGSQINPGAAAMSPGGTSVISAPVTNNTVNNNIIGKTITTRNPESPGNKNLLAY